MKNPLMSVWVVWFHLKRDCVPVAILIGTQSTSLTFMIIRL